MNYRRIALIDLGTNSFHLLIAEVDEEGYIMPLLKQQVPVKLGKGGISKGAIAPDAYQRALFTLIAFQEELQKHQVREVKAMATSAVRSAQNGPQLVADILKQTGISVEVISGELEADLIYAGVRHALRIGNQPSLIVDIGGGSVEFIIANDKRIFWKQSFELGAQRLLDQFFHTDPMTADEVKALKDFLLLHLEPLTAAVAEYKPQVLIGCAGSFETLIDIDSLRKGIVVPQESPHTEEELALVDFQTIYHDLLHKDREERLAIPGMPDMRVDMIVVACILTDLVLHTYSLKHIRISYYALKEGMLAQLIS